MSLDTSGSSLDQPRATVAWDLDGVGHYEADRGSAVEATFTPTSAGLQTIAVEITTRDGTVATGLKTIDVAASPAPEREGQLGPAFAPVAEPQMLTRAP